MKFLIIDLNDILNTFACIRKVIRTVVDMYVMSRLVIIATDCSVCVVYLWNFAMETMIIFITAFKTTITTAIPTLIRILKIYCFQYL